MRPPGASSGEMAEFSLSGRAGPELDEQLLDAMLAGLHQPPDAPRQAAVVAEMLASLASPVYSGHLAGEEAARSAFVRAVSPVPAEPPRRASSWLRGRLSVRLAAAVVAAAAGLSGTVAAYAGALPGPVQDLAHYAIGAPAARVAVADGRRRAGHRLCTSYARAEASGDARAASVALRRLASAAGAGADGRLLSYSQHRRVPCASPELA
jgi:hypothetical protein